MKQEAQTKIHEKLIVERDAHLRKAQFEKEAQKVKVTKDWEQGLVLQIFVVFLKCTLEKGLGSFQHVN